MSNVSFTRFLAFLSPFLEIGGSSNLNQNNWLWEQTAERCLARAAAQSPTRRFPLSTAGFVESKNSCQAFEKGKCSSRYDCSGGNPMTLDHESLINNFMSLICQDLRNTTTWDLQINQMTRNHPKANLEPPGVPLLLLILGCLSEHVKLVQSLDSSRFRGGPSFVLRPEAHQLCPRLPGTFKCKTVVRSNLELLDGYLQWIPANGVMSGSSISKMGRSMSLKAYSALDCNQHPTVSTHKHTQLTETTQTTQLQATQSFKLRPSNALHHLMVPDYSQVTYSPTRDAMWSMAAFSWACLSSSETPQWGVMSPTMASPMSWTSAILTHFSRSTYSPGSCFAKGNKGTLGTWNIDISNGVLRIHITCFSQLFESSSDSCRI